MAITYKKYKNSYGEVQNGAMKFVNGVHVLSLPFDEANRDYQEYKIWVSEGGVIEDAD